jgi:hypothetical protein
MKGAREPSFRSPFRWQNAVEQFGESGEQVGTPPPENLCRALRKKQRLVQIPPHPLKRGLIHLRHRRLRASLSLDSFAFDRVLHVAT